MREPNDPKSKEEREQAHLKDIAAIREKFAQAKAQKAADIAAQTQAVSGEVRRTMNTAVPSEEQMKTVQRLQNEIFAVWGQLSERLDLIEKDGRPRNLGLGESTFAHYDPLWIELAVQLTGIIGKEATLKMLAGYYFSFSQIDYFGMTTTTFFYPEKNIKLLAALEKKVIATPILGEDDSNEARYQVGHK